MNLLLRRWSLLLLCVFACVSLVACGSDDSETIYSSLFSTQTFSQHGIAFKNHSTVTTCGANGYGQLGNGSVYNINVPNKIRPTEGFSEVTAAKAGGAHCVVLDDGKVWTWGYNGYGQLGNGDVTTNYSPIQAWGMDVDEVKKKLSDVQAVAAGGLHTLAISSEGKVLAWGYNYKGQVQQGNDAQGNSPSTYYVYAHEVTGTYTDSDKVAHLFPDTHAFTAVAGGGEFSLALRDDGTVWAWGDNTYGQLGNTSTAATGPVPVQKKNPNDKDTDNPTVNLSNIVAIAAGGSHALALDADGHVWAWGYNRFGQLGDGSGTTRTIAVEVLGTTDLGTKTVRQIAAGLGHSLVLIGTGTAAEVMACGYNYFGQVGNGATLGSYKGVTTFTPVTDLIEISSIVAMGNLSMAYMDDGTTIKTWGDNSYGQLGIGGTINISSSTPVLSSY